MDNAEEVMQLLEEFSKMKPKDIPRELEEYLGYVAKTGDPVYQWSLVKCLFREKLMNVITDFYESTPTLELPPCPNVDPFNYERMKTCLLERLESFPSAPFTVQRICELLTNPRKEYNRADKYMRAIEKNILVVSTREPGSGKRQDGENNQTDAVLNGIPDSRGDVEDGMNSPLLGTPPASNEVIVSTCSEQEEIEISDPSVAIAENDKAWVKTTEDIIPPPSLQDSPLIFKTNSEETETKELGLQEDSTSSLDAVIEEGSELALEPSNETPLLENVEHIDVKEEEEETSSSQPVLTNESEVTSVPEDSTNEVPESSTVITLAPEPEITSNLSLEAEEMITNDVTAQVVSNSEDEETKETINISEIAVNSPSTTEEVEQGEPETKNIIVESPGGSPQNDPIVEADITVEKDSLQTISEDRDPDSSNELVQYNKMPMENDEKFQSELEGESEAEPLPDSLSLPDPPIASEVEESESPKHEDSNNIEIIPEVILPSESTSEEKSKTPEPEVHETSEPEADEIPEIVSSVDISNSENSSNIDTTIKEKPSDDVIESTNEICDHERREGSIIHSTPNLIAEVEPVLAMEEVSVDQSSCGVEEEAMDVDESSNQQMVMSEGENEGEPMDQSDQPQS